MGALSNLGMLLVQALSVVIDAYKFVIFVWVIISWLVMFNVLNPWQPFVRSVMMALERLTAPALKPIRRMMPDLGGIDLSPIVLLFALWFLQQLLWQVIAPAIG